MQEAATATPNPSPPQTGNPAGRSKTGNKIEAFFNQENIATLVVAVIIGVAVILPLVALFINSFLVLDSSGWDTEWGFDNYIEMVTDRIIP